MKSVVIRALGFANGMPCPHENEWLKNFDHEAFNGQGHGVFTDRIEHALRFAAKNAPLAFWNKQSTVRPLRPDGRPNKPLTALTVEIEEIL
jgi:hypothetical protein